MINLSVITVMMWLFRRFNKKSLPYIWWRSRRHQRHYVYYNDMYVVILNLHKSKSGIIHTWKIADGLWCKNIGFTVWDVGTYKSKISFAGRPKCKRHAKIRFKIWKQEKSGKKKKRRQFSFGMTQWCRFVDGDESSHQTVKLSPSFSWSQLTTWVV